MKKRSYNKSEEKESKNSIQQRLIFDRQEPQWQYKEDQENGMGDPAHDRRGRPEAKENHHPPEDQEHPRAQDLQFDQAEGPEQDPLPDQADLPEREDPHPERGLPAERDPPCGEVHRELLPIRIARIRGRLDPVRIPQSVRPGKDLSCAGKNRSPVLLPKDCDCRSFSQARDTEAGGIAKN